METLSYKKEHVAVKNHICNFCGERIMAGEKYNKSTHKHEGEVYDWKTHTLCDYVAERLDMYEEADENGLTGDAFQETVSEKHFDEMVKVFDQKELSKYSEVLQQLRFVRFKDMLAFVIRLLKKQEIISNLPTK